jgi:hypothetical protein
MSAKRLRALAVGSCRLWLLAIIVMMMAVVDGGVFARTQGNCSEFIKLNSDRTIMK